RSRTLVTAAAVALIMMPRIFPAESPAGMPRASAASVGLAGSTRPVGVAMPSDWPSKASMARIVLSPIAPSTASADAPLRLRRTCTVLTSGALLAPPLPTELSMHMEASVAQTKHSDGLRLGRDPRGCQGHCARPPRRCSPPRRSGAARAQPGERVAQRPARAVGEPALRAVDPSAHAVAGHAEQDEAEHVERDAGHDGEQPADDAEGEH